MGEPLQRTLAGTFEDTKLRLAYKKHPRCQGVRVQGYFRKGLPIKGANHTGLRVIVTIGHAKGDQKPASSFSSDLCPGLHPRAHTCC